MKICRLKKRVRYQKPLFPVPIESSGFWRFLVIFKNQALKRFFKKELGF
jgi:hypothetical protein